MEKYSKLKGRTFFKPPIYLVLQIYYSLETLFQNICSYWGESMFLYCEHTVGAQ